MLKLAFDWALAGDDEPVAIADRPEVRRMMQGAGSAVLVAAWVAMNAAIAGRMAALHHVLVVAADADPEAAALARPTVEQQRTQAAQAFVDRGSQEIGGLRRELDVDRADAIAELLMDPMPYRRLVLRTGLDARGVHRLPPAGGRRGAAVVNAATGRRTSPRRRECELLVGLIAVHGLEPPEAQRLDPHGALIAQPPRTRQPSAPARECRAGRGRRCRQPRPACRRGPRTRTMTPSC